MDLIFVGSQFEMATEHLEIPDSRVVMMVDMDRCIRCGTCQMACWLEHGKEGGTGEVRILKMGGENEVKAPIFSLPGSCRQCRTPCPYYTINNFWIRCPEERTPAKEKELACDLCLDRWEKGYWPACATRCPMKTIYVGTMEEMKIVLRDKRFREYGDFVIHG
ncbi:MAG: hypothetical protein AB1502_13975 [Thermodesulfobacteriota bacterium]